MVKNVIVYIFRHVHAKEPKINQLHKTKHVHLSKFGTESRQQSLSVVNFAPFCDLEICLDAYFQFHIPEKMMMSRKTIQLTRKLVKPRKTKMPKQKSGKGGDLDRIYVNIVHI